MPEGTPQISGSRSEITWAILEQSELTQIKGRSIPSLRCPAALHGNGGDPPGLGCVKALPFQIPKYFPDFYMFWSGEMQKRRFGCLLLQKKKVLQRFRRCRVQHLHPRPRPSPASFACPGCLLGASPRCRDYLGLGFSRPPPPPIFPFSCSRVTWFNPQHPG